MIPINELRFGNWIEDSESKKRYQIEWFSKSAENLCNPIPLTPEILERCGFEKIRDGYERRISDNLRLFSVGQYQVSHFKEEIFGKTIGCLHQLQNLYFALTGEELQINSEILNGNTSKV